MKIINKNSIANRLIGMYFATSFIVLALFSLLVVYSVKHHFYQQDYQLLHNKFLTISSELRNQNNNDVSLPISDTAYFWVLDKDGKTVITNTDQTLPVNAIKKNAYEWIANGQQYRGFQFKLNNSQYSSVFLGLNIDYHTRFIKNFNFVLLIFFLITITISGMYSIFIVRRGLEPLRTLQRYLSRINTSRLDIRVPTEEFPIELSLLVETQNQMLERLQKGFERLSEFSSDIAHELRTPLTNIMTQNQVTLSTVRTIDEYQDVLCSNTEELERLNKMIQDTLYLAKSENQLLHSKKEYLHLSKIIEPLIEYYEILSEEKNVRLELTGDSIQFGDKHMLQRAVGNILSNALRHCENDSVISVHISSDNMFNTIKITNTGDEIPQNAIPYLFDRFYRADKSRKHVRSVGAGLGLAIAQSIVQLHKGQITVSSSERLTEFQIVLSKNE